MHNQIIPLLLGMLVGGVLAGLGWGVLRAGWLRRGPPWLRSTDSMLVWFLIVAMFALGAFVTYAVLEL
jgi:hypothetical protein